MHIFKGIEDVGAGDETVGVVLLAILGKRQFPDADIEAHAQGCPRTLRFSKRERSFSDCATLSDRLQKPVAL